MNRRILIAKSLLTGARKGLNGFAWVMKITVPISFLTAVLVWSGWLAKSQVFIQPVMKWLSLPAEAALPLLIGIFAGIYGAIAAMAVLPLSTEHVTLIAVFLLIAHALIQESAIQGKAGIHPLKVAVYRLIAAVTAVMLVAPFLDIPTQTLPVSAGQGSAIPPFAPVFFGWLRVTGLLALKMFAIIMSVLILLELMKALGWIDRIVTLFRPMLKILGLSERTGPIWMTASIFGLMYSAPVIVEEIRSGHLDKEERERLNLSVGINHSMIEDPALFLSFGLNPFWLWVPRLVMAVLAVRIYNLCQAVKRRRLSGPLKEGPH